MNFCDGVIVTFGKNDYRIYFSGMTKSQTLNRMKSLDLSEKSGQC